MSLQVQDANGMAAHSLATSASKPGEKLRVLHVVSRLGMGGTEHGILKVIRGLGEDQFEHRICAVRGIDAEFARNMNVARAYSVDSARPGFQFPLFRLMKIMREFRPHVVHSRNFGALEAIPAARAARVPVAIHSEHGYELEILSGLPLRRRVLCRSFYGMADAVFTVTRDLLSYHSKQSWLPPGRFRVIYNGVNLHRFSGRSGPVTEIRRKYGIPENVVVIGSVGRMVPIKDHVSLLRAAEELLLRRKNVHVLLVGDGPELAKLREVVAASPALAGRVTLPGASDSVPELLSVMDVFVLPSIREGMSNTLLEAMASGLPIVASRTGGNSELVDDRQCGRLFSPRDVQALTGILAELVEDGALRRRLGEEARKRAAERFSLSGMIQQYRDLYLGLALRRGAWKRK